MQRKCYIIVVTQALVVCLICPPSALGPHNTGTRGLPDMYTQSPRACGPRALGVHIRQTTSACVTTVTCIYIYIYIYILEQLTGKARSAVRISLAPHAILLMPLRRHTVHEMHPRGLTASKKATCKSRSTHLVSSTWCLWIVQACDFRLQAKNGFQYLCP